MKVATLGAGAFGKAIHLIAQAGGDACLLGRRDAAGVVTDWRAELRGADLVAMAVPAQATRQVLQGIGGLLRDDAALVMLAKGIEAKTGALQTEIAADEAPNHPVMVLTGPSFASEMLDGLPTAVTLASGDAELGERVQARLAGPTFRPYLSDDVTGAQIGGAMKNVIAIACGAAMGRGLGESARAALMTRGFAEMTRVAIARGAKAETLAGLSGFGDLALTCASAKSRNFAFGFALGEGRLAPGATYEGVATAQAAVSLANGMNIDAPLAKTVAALVAGEQDVDGAMTDLLSRPLRRET